MALELNDEQQQNLLEAIQLIGFQLTENAQLGLFLITALENAIIKGGWTELAVALDTGIDLCDEYRDSR